MHENKVVRRSRPLAMLFLLAGIGAWFGITIQATAATRPGVCSENPESRQLDYWLGTWTITHPGASANATSNVHLSLDKCLLVESWDGGKGHTGENMFAYSSDDNSWYGMFADNEGRVHIFTDGKVGSGSAEFKGASHGPNGEMFLNRVKIVRRTPNRVEQTWEKSSDNGGSWTVVFRGDYSRVNP